MPENKPIKIERCLEVLLTATTYRNDIPKFVEYIKKNREFFPKITDKDLEQMLI